MEKYLVCLECHSLLKRKKKEYICKKCGNSYKIIKGVPSFTQPIMDEKRDFNAGVPKDLKKYPQYLVTEFLDNKFGLKNKQVLDLGCGWGGITFQLLKKGSKVTATDIVLQRLLYLKKKNLENLKVVHLDAEKLPFKNNYFDIVILRGVLEWVAVGKSGNPKKIQERVLKEISRVLKKKGILYLAIENRYDIKMFFGVKEHHTGLRFVSIMPRWIADIYSKIMRGVPFRNYTYSRGELEKMLKNAGFSVDFYTPIPNYIAPDIHAKLNKKEIIKALKQLPFLEHSRYRGIKGVIISKIAILLTKIGLYERAVTNFVIIGKAK